MPNNSNIKTKNKKKISNSLDPDELAHNKPSYLDLQGLPSSL